VPKEVKKNPAGWIILGVVLGLLIIAGIFGVIIMKRKRDSANSENPYDEI